jgi:hypothetical protein
MAANNRERMMTTKKELLHQVIMDSGNDVDEEVTEKIMSALSTEEREVIEAIADTYPPRMLAAMLVESRMETRDLEMILDALRATP